MQAPRPSEDPQFRSPRSLKEEWGLNRALIVLKVVVSSNAGDIRGGGLVM